MAEDAHESHPAAVARGEGHLHLEQVVAEIVVRGHMSPYGLARLAGHDASDQCVQQIDGTRGDAIQLRTKNA